GSIERLILFFWRCLRPALSAASPRSFVAVGFPLLSLTQFRQSGNLRFRFMIDNLDLGFFLIFCGFPATAQFIFSFRKHRLFHNEDTFQKNRRYGKTGVSGIFKFISSDENFPSRGSNASG